MSWQSYVDDQLLSTKMIKNAVIAGHDGNIWATSNGFPVSLQNCVQIAAAEAVYPRKKRQHKEPLGNILLNFLENLILFL